jgi:rare lipoprotein A
MQSGTDAAATADGSSSNHRLPGDAAPSASAQFASEVNTRGAAGESSATPPTAAATTAAAVPTTVPAPVETTLPTQNVASHVAVATTTTAPPPAPTTTTTRPVPVPVTGSVHYGQVTYYDHPAGRCASPFLAFGTVVRITNPANGESVSCVVDDREADTARSIDLATGTFALIAPLSQGVINAELTW